MTTAQTHSLRTLILASSSPRRQELIRSLGLPFVIQASDADESVPSGWEPARIVETLSLRKAEAVYRQSPEPVPGGIVIGSDTIVVLDGQVLGKPQDEADAKRMLSRLQGRTHHVYSGVACLDADSGRSVAASRATRVHMNPLTPRQIEHCVATGEPLDKAGAYDNTMYLGDTGQYRILSETSSGQPEIIVGHTVSKVTFRPMSDEEIKGYVKTGDPLDKAGAYGVQGLGSVFVERIEGDFYSIMGLPLNLLYQMLLKFGISPFKFTNTKQ